MSGTVKAVARHKFTTLSAEAVYDAWIDPDRLRAWMQQHLRMRKLAADITRIEVDAVVGGRFLFADTRPDSEAWGYYRVLARPEQLVFTWFVSAEEEEEDNSVVTIDLVGHDGGCAATVTHEMDAQWSDYVDRTAQAWASMLEAIEAAQH